MTDSAVGGTHPIVPDRGHDQGHYGQRHGGQAPAPSATPPPPRDRVDLCAAEDAVLQVLRERVLARTRDLLELPVAHGGPSFAGSGPGATAAEFVGRLMSEQNLLAAARAADWEPERIRNAVAESLTLGAGDALDVLQDVGRLDAAAWEAVEGVLAAFRKKIGSAAQPAAGTAD